MQYLTKPAGALIALTLSITWSTGSAATTPEAPATALPEVVVTAPAMSAPLTVETDPQAPRQPIPAHEGADYLKTIPGFSVIRKGGSDGDPVFRGMAGSRLNILLDGENILGGCGMRMDPPTAYVFPESYDRITVLKGPQTVLYGPGNSAGTVLFERDHTRQTEAGWQGHAGVTVGSFDRHDEVADIRAGNRDFYGRLNATRAHANDYEDGNGTRVHSQHERWSANANVGWTPDDNTWMELSLAESDGEAAYRDRSMDGSLFARENTGLKMVRKNISPLWKKVELQAYRNYIDHVMDNHSLRVFTPSMMMANPSASNPDRLTEGGRVSTELAATENLRVTLGVDVQKNTHTARSTANQLTMPYQNMARTADASFDQYGLFGESTWAVDDNDRIIGGVRSDRWQATDERAPGMGGSGMGPVTSVTSGSTRSDTLESGFLRHEHDYSEHSTIYGGIGHTQRFPDYWELVPKESAATTSAFLTTNPEQNTQLDIGWIRSEGAVSLSLSGFYSDLHDYILIQSFPKPTMMNPANKVNISRNVDAQSFGGEAGAGYAISDNLKADVSLAYVRGINETDNTPLAQQPPLEARLGLNWDNRTFSAGALLRAVNRQDRVDPDKGNIAGQDIGATPGFAVFSLNGSWRPATDVLLAAGIDNLFDIDYAEHLSRSGMSMITGFVQTTRVNEPGRNLWLKASVDF